MPSVCVCVFTAILEVSRDSRVIDRGGGGRESAGYVRLRSCV